MRLRLLAAWAMALVMGLAADTAHAGPDPPQGKYGIYIRANDGTFEEVPLGEPVVYAEAQWCPPGSATVWGLAVHGKVNLPNPGGAGWTWRVRCVSFYDVLGDEEAFSVYDGGGHGPNAWTAQVIGGDWCIWAAPEFGVWWGLPAGMYEATFRLEVNGPGTGGWFPVPNATTTAYFTW